MRREHAQHARAARKRTVAYRPGARGLWPARVPREAAYRRGLTPTGSDRQSRRRLHRRALAELLGEGRDYARVELRARAAPQLCERRVCRTLGPVDAIRRHRVVGVGHEDDAGPERDLVALQAVGIAGAVPALMVVQHQVGDRVDAEAVELAEADLRMPLEH